MVCIITHEDEDNIIFKEKEIIQKDIHLYKEYSIIIRINALISSVIDNIYLP